MATQLNVDDQADINLSVGVDSDYTFTSTNPALATVDADGIVTGVAEGLVAIKIVRNSDGIRVGNILFNIVDPSVQEIDGDLEITVTPVVPTLIADISAATVQNPLVTLVWTYIDLETQISGHTPNYIVILTTTGEGTSENFLSTPMGAPKDFASNEDTTVVGAANELVTVEIAAGYYSIGTGNLVGPVQATTTYQIS